MAFSIPEQKLVALHPQMAAKYGATFVLNMHMDGTQRGFLPTRSTRMEGLVSNVDPSVDVNIFHMLSDLPQGMRSQISHMRQFQEFLQVKFMDDMKSIRQLIQEWQQGNLLEEFERLLDAFYLTNSTEI